MVGKYHQGEDIVLTINIYNDKSMSEKEDLTDYKIDVLLIDSNNETLYASTDSDSSPDTLIKTDDNYTLKVHFTASQTSLLSEGNANLEVRVKNLTTEETSISKSDLLFIESSEISKLT